VQTCAILFACKTVFTRLAKHTRGASLPRDLIGLIVSRDCCASRAILRGDTLGKKRKEKTKRESQKRSGCSSFVHAFGCPDESDRSNEIIRVISIYNISHRDAVFIDLHRASIESEFWSNYPSTIEKCDCNCSFSIIRSLLHLFPVILNGAIERSEIDRADLTSVTRERVDLVGESNAFRNAR